MESCDTDIMQASNPFFINRGNQGNTSWFITTNNNLIEHISDANLRESEQSFYQHIMGTQHQIIVGQLLHILTLPTIHPMIFHRVLQILMKVVKLMDVVEVMDVFKQVMIILASQRIQILTDHSINTYWRCNVTQMLVLTIHFNHRLLQWWVKDSINLYIKQWKQ